MNTLTKSRQQLSVAVQIKGPGRRKFCFCLLVSTLSDEFIYPGYYIPSLILQSIFYIFFRLQLWTGDQKYSRNPPEFQCQVCNADMCSFANEASSKVLAYQV